MRIIPVRPRPFAEGTSLSIRYNENRVFAYPFDREPREHVAWQVDVTAADFSNVPIGKQIRFLGKNLLYLIFIAVDQMIGEFQINGHYFYPLVVVCA